jgi:hypothetical protein
VPALLLSARPGRPSGRTLLVAAVLVAAGLFYGWTAWTSSVPHSGRAQADPYNRLTDAFLDGRLDLAPGPPPGLLALPNPYDPVANAAFRTPDVNDLSLRDGRLYAYWGPTPALTLFLPYRALGAGDLPPAIAALVFALVGLAAAVALLVTLQRRFLPATAGWQLALGAVALALCSVVPYVLRRPQVYETAILSGYCFVWLALLLLARLAVAERGGLGALAGASLCAGLAFASRPTAGVAVVALAAAAVVVLRRREAAGRGRRVAVLGAALGPWALCVAALAAYNAARFGSPTEFGIRYQLGSQDFHSREFYALRYLGPGLWHYLVAAPLPRVEFPFAWLNPTRSDPFGVPDYDGLERIAGTFVVAPAVLLLALAPWALRGAAPALRRIVAAAAAAPAVIVLFLALLFWGCLMRYEADYTSFLLTGALLTWFAATRRAAPGRGRVAVKATGATLIVFGALVGVAISLVGEDDRYRFEHPGTWASMQRLTAPLATGAAAIAGHPILSSIDGEAVASPQRYGQLGVQGYTMEIGATPRRLGAVSGSRETASLRVRLVRGPAIPQAQPLAFVVRSAGGFAASAQVDGRRHDIPVVLGRGRNDLHVAVVSDRPLPPATPSRLGQVWAQDLDLVARKARR